ncbi:MAG TPA: DUF4136 domain-containing protein [Polyangia bacterium]
MLLVLLAPAACVTVRSSTSPNANLAQYRTFAWYVSPAPTERQQAFDRSPAGELVRDRIARDLADKGIHATSGAPDFFVAYHTRLEQKLDVNDWGYPSVFWGAAPGPVTVDEYTQGTLMVDFIDPKTGQVFWRGTATSVVDHPENPNLQKLASAVDKVMKRYPSELATATASRPAM